MTEAALALPVSSTDIDAAARVLAPFAVRTPLLWSPVLNERAGTKVFLKPEMLQRTGSFKFRGAFNKLSSIPQAARGGGVVAFSSGNHAQGVAAAAKILNMQATIVMPADAPLSKRERTKSYGAEVVLYDRDREDREAIARGSAGKRQAHGSKGRTICDALMATMPGELTFSINSRLLTEGITASDAEVGIAVGFAFRELKLVVEPGGAVGLAALLAGRIDVRGKNVVIVLSGGNVDADLFAKLVA